MPSLERPESERNARVAAASSARVLGFFFVFSPQKHPAPVFTRAAMMRVKRTRVPTEMLRARHLAGTRPEPPSKTSTPASLFFSLLSHRSRPRSYYPRLRIFLAVAKRSGLESMVVPGGVFHEVAGDVTVFAPEDAALERELAFFARVFALTVAEVKRDAPLLQEILRQFVAYGDARLGDRRGVFVTLDGSVWRWGDPNVPGDGVSEIALVPVGVQLDEPPVVFEVDDDAGARCGCSRGLRLSRIVRDNVRARSAIRRARRRDVRAYYERGFGSRR